MKKRHHSILRHFLPRLTIYFVTFFFLILTGSISGCGGGTQGTGDVGASTVIGHIRTGKGVAISDVRVVHLETGEEAITDKKGRFSIKTSLEKEDPSFLVQSDRTDLPEIDKVVKITAPAGTSELEIDLSIDEVSGIVSVVSVKIDEPEVTPSSTPTPAATLNPSDDKSPTPSPTQTKPVPKVYQEVSGVVLSSKQKPLSGISISIEGGTSTTTDALGAFSLRGNSEDGTLRFKVLYKKASGSMTVRGVPKNRNSRVTLTIILTLEGSGVDPNDPNAGDPYSISISPSGVVIK